MREIDTFGQARFILADDVGLGKTVQLGMAAELIALTDVRPVLVLAPKNLLLQWQDELQRMLAVPSARWVEGKWITEDGVVWPKPPDACPRRIGLFPTSLVTAGSASAEALLGRCYACVILDEAHRARRSRARGKEGEATKLLRFMLNIAPAADTVLLGTATPIQVDRMEIYDLMRILHGGCERVLGGIGSLWTVPERAMDMVTGKAAPPRTGAERWAWLRDPLIPRGEHALADRIRATLGVPDGATSAPRDAFDGFTPPLKQSIDNHGAVLIERHNPFLRHVVKRRRSDLKNPDGSPVFREVAVRRHGEGDDDALVMPQTMAEAYDDAKVYCELIAKIRPGAGILKTLLLRRIGSSLHAGLSTARKLLVGEEQTAVVEEDEPLGAEGVADVGGEALGRLQDAVRRMEAAGDDDPKLHRVLDHLRRDGWLVRGCILFSQYLDTVLWLAGHLARAFPGQPVGVYGGQGNSYLIEGEQRRGAGREQIQSLVQGRGLRLLVATDAASEGLNLQRLETLINVDLPWNPARLEQRKGRIDRIGQRAEAIDILNLRYRGSVEDDVHRALSARLETIRAVFGTIPDTLEDVWVEAAVKGIEAARQKIDEVPERHPFDLRYGADPPPKDWARCAQVLDRHDVEKVLKQGW